MGKTLDAGIDLTRHAVPTGLPLAAVMARVAAAPGRRRGRADRAWRGLLQAARGAELILRSRRATTAVEYALITSVIAVSIVMSLDMFDSKLRRVYAALASAL
jgi:Flp pilus assembly pilin Flp